MTDFHSFDINHGCFKGKYVQKAPTSERHTHHTDVTKLVCSSHSVVIQERCCGDPPGVSVISKDNELVLIPFVTHPDETLLNVWNNHSVPNGLDPTDVVGNVLLREKGQNLSASIREVYPYSSWNTTCPCELQPTSHHFLQNYPSLCHTSVPL